VQTPAVQALPEPVPSDLNQYWQPVLPVTPEVEARLAAIPPREDVELPPGYYGPYGAQATQDSPRSSDQAPNDSVPALIRTSSGRFRLLDEPEDAERTLQERPRQVEHAEGSQELRDPVLGDFIDAWVRPRRPIRARPRPNIDDDRLAQFEADARFRGFMLPQDFADDRDSLRGSAFGSEDDRVPSLTPGSASSGSSEPPSSP
jgi:hypothetical protein